MKFIRLTFCFLSSIEFFRPDANIQLQLTLEIYESPNDEEFLKVIFIDLAFQNETKNHLLVQLFPTLIGMNNGNPEVVFVLITTLNFYLLRQLAEAHDSSQIERIECIRLEEISEIEVDHFVSHFTF